MITPDEFKRRIKEHLCIECAQPFTSSNVHSDAGWRETHISHICEDCFDVCTALPEDDEDVPTEPTP